MTSTVVPFDIPTKQLYIAQLQDREYRILTNIQCVKCFEIKYKCKTSSFFPIDDKYLEEWKKIVVSTLTGECICNKKNY